MKLQEPVNPNYAATVVRLHAINILPNCDNVVGAPLFGYQSIVSKDHQVGDLGIMFPPEVQLGPFFCTENNLYRHGNLNKNPEKTGYIEDNRRVKAIKFRGHQSNCLFMPLDSLSWTGINIGDLKEGDTFDAIDGVEICRKYVSRVAREPGMAGSKKGKSADPRVDILHIPEHPDTQNYFKNSHSIAGDTQIIVTQKLHGSSVRIGHTFVKRQLTWMDRVAKRFGVKVQEMEHDYIFASRKVIKDPGNPTQQHYYGSDIWSEAGEKLRGLLPKGCVVFGEIIGWTSDGAAIQKGYTYDVPQGGQRLYVYRVAMVNESGFLVDLAWDQVKEFCNNLGLLHVPEMQRGEHDEIDVQAYLDMNFADNMLGVVPVGKGKVDEGVCIRVDGLSPFGSKPVSNTWIEGDVDNTAYEISHFLFLATKSNPTILETFVAPITVSGLSGWGAELRALFPYVWDSDQALAAFTGYGYNQRKKFLDNKDNRANKYAVAWLRTLIMATELFSTGTINLDLSRRDADGSTYYAHGEYETLQLWKAGIWKLGEVMDTCDEWEDRARVAHAQSEKRKPDLDRINEFLLRVRKAYWE